MKSYDLQPTNENIIQTFADDLIERNKDALRFMILLDNIEDSCSIALDGKWGSGKTFFVKQLKMIIEAYNPFITNDAINYNNIKSSLQRSEVNPIEFQPQIPVYYDAWANDNDVDPILSIVHEIIKSVNSDFDFKKRVDCLQVAGAIADFFSPKALSPLIELARTEDPFAKLKEQKDIQILISQFLETILVEQGNRLVIFVDELDRCKPTYAVQLLERVKHYFSSNLVTFVFSVNIDQLQHTIKHFYGADFDACRYLDRFFDLRISLPPANLTRFYQKLGLSGSYVFEKVCQEVIRVNHFELREISKYYRMTRAAAYKPTHSSDRFMFDDGRALEFCLMCIVPIMIGTKISNTERYNALIQGKDSSPLIEVMESAEIGKNICALLLGQRETYQETQPTGVVKVKLSDKLNQVYNALFVHDFSKGIYEIPIGQLSFSQETHDVIIRVVSLLSDFTDFNI